MNIEIRQFIPPNGRQLLCATEIPDRMRQLYEEMVAAGYEFQAEILTTGEVSLTISDSERDVDIMVMPNGPAVTEALIQLLLNANWR